MKNTEVINRFYKAFQEKDYKTMQSLYARHAVFNDPVFTNLSSDEVKAMWEMLLKRGKDLELTFSNVHETITGGTAEWVATYTFSASGRKVKNRIKATFEIANGMIVRHTDHFSFYRWASQALGLPGLLLGWSPLIKNKVRATAKQNLGIFMNRKDQP